ncbi:hypothetical protein ILUMI_01693 [Ignelater luminosus]|uniref:Uncharacterized protein n=1 Tax=Ignelater luminosus TaxID=2038154 RepID=A0A8K0GK05_IGNLU|nr:hypothetical protein ILUMI_01693 [Ignelater luminosus]
MLAKNKRLNGSLQLPIRSEKAKVIIPKGKITKLVNRVEEIGGPTCGKREISISWILKVIALLGYTYQLSEEKSIRVVIRGIPSEIDTVDVKDDLEEKGFQVNSVVGNVVGKERRPTPLVLVSIKKDISHST